MNYKSRINYIIDRNFFRNIYLFLCILYFMPSSYNIEYFPLWGTIGLGTGILLSDLFKKNNFLQIKHMKILTTFVASYILSIFLNFNFVFIRGVYNLLFLILTFFVIYPVGCDESEDEVKKNLTNFNDILIFTVFVGAVISIFMFFINLKYNVNLNNLNMRQGFQESRIFGIYTSPNIGTILGFLSVVASLLNNVIKRTSYKKFSTFYKVNLLTQYLFFLLASSRGTKVTTIVFLFLFSSFIILPSFIEKTHRKKYSLIITVSIFIASLYLLSGMNGLLQKGLSYIPAAIESYIENDEQSSDSNIEKEKKPIKPVVIQHSPEDAEVSSGRITIWKAAVSVVRQFPIFGAGDASFYRNDKQHSKQLDENRLSSFDIRELKRVNGNMHNTYIQVLIMSGIAGFIILLIFVLIQFKDSFLILINSSTKTSQNYQIMLIISLLLLSLFVEDLFENHLLFNVKDVVSIVFWYYLGILNYLKGIAKEGVK